MNTEGLDAEARFRATVAEILMAYQGADNEHRLQSNAMNYLPAAQRDILVGYQRKLVRHVSGLVEAIAPDVFAGDAPKLRATTMSIFGMLNWFYMWNQGADETARRAYAATVCDLCLKGLPGV
ncbi:MAG: hypothetical protein AAF393_16505 [Pseudomonadota bacterium]